MTPARRIRHILQASALAIVAFSASVSAQEVSESHLKAARAAVDAINATDIFDGILPQASFALKQEMIRKNPDREPFITQTIDEVTLSLAARRTDLEREAALAYARVFSEEDLNGIAVFYNSAPGKKLLTDGPIVTREVDRAASIWSKGVARDLAQAAGEKLRSQIGDAASAVDPAAAGALAPEGAAN